MMNYGESPANLESRSNLRRIARHDEPEFSNASILHSMEKFVKAVSEMEETILVPSRLLDLAVGDASDTVSQKGLSNIKNTMPHTDLYRLYNIVTKTKLELMWSQKSNADTQDDEDEITDDVRRKNRATSDAVRLGHARCPSTTSMQSMQSASSLISSSSSCDSDSDIGIEIDSGLESEDSPNDRCANQAAETFRRHLHGLHRSIKRMTSAAEYLTLRYQIDVGGQV
ncbi:uncharacterized protein LOC107048288 [Diachasma alloeum]|uniref:uncharacterized protein LOC107048288 n=1 Tax=Diachasma alloeum TaxID=454923 RepID=UPI0007383046|nr:uncharacterized protein LOC107048288 [Diachasma alloeum]